MIIFLLVLFSLYDHLLYSKQFIAFIVILAFRSSGVHVLPKDSCQPHELNDLLEIDSIQTQTKPRSTRALTYRYSPLSRCACLARSLHLVLSSATALAYDSTTRLFRTWTTLYEPRLTRFADASLPHTHCSCSC